MDRGVHGDQPDGCDLLAEVLLVGEPAVWGDARNLSGLVLDPDRVEQAGAE
jgi:hypothetical protein